MSKTLKFKSNINCGGCINAVTPTLDSIAKGKWSVDIDDPDKILTIEDVDLSEEEIKEKVKEVGYELEEISN